MTVMITHAERRQMIRTETVHVMKIIVPFLKMQVDFAIPGALNYTTFPINVKSCCCNGIEQQAFGCAQQQRKSAT